MAKNLLKIEKGKDITFDLRVRIQSQDASDGDPFDLTSASEITARFPHASNSSPNEAKLTSGEITILEAKAGKMQISLNDTFTSNIKEGERQDWEVNIDKGTDNKRIRFEEGLSVFNSVFS